MKGGQCGPSSAGSVDEFIRSWTFLPDGARYHFSRDEPRNQLQFAFQRHWRTFSRILDGRVSGGTALEVGCGRGSMAAFFADAGFDTHLLDTSRDALHLARRNFEEDGLGGRFVCGDALRLPYPDHSFNAVVSIGLLEHFEDIEWPIAEQMRVLRPGGVMLAYVVPEKRLSAQTVAAPINWLLASVQGSTPNSDSQVAKEALFRNAYTGDDYLSALERIGASDAGTVGMFPVPLVSHSPAFPFSFNPPPVERALVATWGALMTARFWRKDPWTCREGWGLAFLVWAQR